MTLLDRTPLLNDKAQALLAMLRALQPIYRDVSDNDRQKNFIETTIGAAVFYLPQPKELWTGLMSRELLSAFLESDSESKPKMTKDHVYPRKAVARALLEYSWGAERNPLETLLRLYESKYGTYVWVTSAENRRLMPHQKNIDLNDPYRAYQAAEVGLVTLSHREFKQVRQGQQALIERLLEEG
jgi:hypothetical protein